MATDSHKTLGPQEQRQLAALKEKLANLDQKLEEYEAKGEHPEHDRAGAIERIKAGRKELADEIKRLEGPAVKEAKK